MAALARTKHAHLEWVQGIKVKGITDKLFIVAVLEFVAILPCRPFYS